MASQGRDPICRARSPGHLLSSCQSEEGAWCQLRVSKALYVFRCPFCSSHPRAQGLCFIEAVPESVGLWVSPSGGPLGSPWQPGVHCGADDGADHSCSCCRASVSGRVSRARAGRHWDGRPHSERPGREPLLSLQALRGAGHNWRTPQLPSRLGWARV